MLEVPLHDAVLGARTKIDSFDGELDVDIEPGVQTGTIITLKGKGVTHLRANGRGDLKISIQVITPSKLDSKQKDLFRTLAGFRKDEKIKLVTQSHGRFAGKRKG